MQADPRRVVDSTVTPLAAGTSYVGPWIDALRYHRASAVFSSDSSTSQVRLDHGTDGTANGLVRSTLNGSVTGSIEEPLYGRYVRLAVVAGATLQTRLTAQLILS